MDVAKLGELIKKWGEIGYPCLSEKERKPVEDRLVELFGAVKKGDEQAGADLKFLNSIFPKPKLTDYDLKEHFSRLIQKYGVHEKPAALFAEKLQVADVYANIPMERLYDKRRITPSVDEKTALQYRERVNGIVKRLTAAKGQPNELLAEMLEGRPLVVYFEDKNDQDACMSEIFLDGKRCPLMIIEKGMMDTNRVSEDHLATTIAHELGHWIDFGNRPADYLGKEKLWQECFADVTGYLMAQNAGYDAQVMISEKEKFAKEHRQWAASKGKPLPDKTIFEERTELLKAMFGEDKKQVNILSLMQATQKIR